MSGSASKNRVFSKTVLILFGIGLSLCILELSMRIAGRFLSGREEQGLVNPGWEKADVRILCLGESTTAPTYHDHSWPAQLERILAENSPGEKVSVLNAGRSATSTTILLAKLPTQLDTYRPNIVISMMGVNDSKWYGVVEPNGIGRLRAILARLKIYRLAQYFYHLTTPRLSPAPPPVLYASLRLHEECLRELSSSHQKDGGEKACRAAIKTDPYDWEAYLGLASLYSRQSRYADAAALTKLATKNEEGFEAHQLSMAEDLMKENKTASKAEELLQYAVMNFRDLNLANAAGRYLADFYYAHWKPRLAVQAYQQVLIREMGAKRGDEVSLQLYTRGYPANEDSIAPVTAANYRRMSELTAARNIPLVVMQYPRQPIEVLKNIFPSQENILFISNQKNFEDALRHRTYAELFRDKFGGTWGHCTAEGDRLIAENVYQNLRSRGYLLKKQETKLLTDRSRVFP